MINSLYVKEPKQQRGWTLCCLQVWIKQRGIQLMTRFDVIHFHKNHEHSESNGNWQNTNEELTGSVSLHAIWIYTEDMSSVLCVSQSVQQQDVTKVKKCTTISEWNDKTILTVALLLVSVSMELQPAWQGDLNSTPSEPQTGLKASWGHWQPALHDNPSELKTNT